MRNAVAQRAGVIAVLMLMRAGANAETPIAGFSGGANARERPRRCCRSPVRQLTGIFLTGINEDRLSEGYRTLKPGAAFLETPIFLSSGQADQVARLAQQQAVKQSMERTGFTRVRQETFPEGHAVSRSAVRTALRWFRSLL